jgi:hypothetical protein
MIRFMEGETVEALALRYDIKESTVAGILTSPLVQEEMKKIADLAGVPERIVNLSMTALDMVRDTMQGANTSELRFKAAKDLLDRNPESRGDKQTDGDKFSKGLGEAIIASISKKLADKAVAKPAESEKGNGESTDGASKPS